MTTTLFTTRMSEATSSRIAQLSQRQKMTKRQIVESAIEAYDRAYKRDMMRASFQHIGQDQEVMDLSEAGLDTLENI